MFKLKLKTLLLITIMVFSVGFFNPKPASAQFIVSDIATGVLTGLTKVWDSLKDAYKKSGSIIFQQTLSNALNKIAIDSATWMASGNKGQTPLMNLKEFGSYLGDIANEAAGEFIERSVNAWSQAFVDEQNAEILGCTEGLVSCNQECAASQRIALNQLAVDKCIQNCDVKDVFCPIDCELTSAFEEVEITKEAEACFSACNQEELKCRQAIGKSLAPGQAIMRQVNVCQPSSPMGFQVKMQISLGLVEHVRPRAPNCTASDMIRSWNEAGKRIDFNNFDDRQWSQNLTKIFHPTNNELGIATIMSSDMFDVMDEKRDIARLNIDQDGRWLDLRNIAGNTEKTAEQTKAEKEAAEKMLHENIGKVTGDVFVDAANVFLNTLALKYYQKAMQDLSKLLSGGQDEDGAVAGSNVLTDPDLDPSVAFTKVDYGEGDSLRERIAKIISPQYSSLDDYNILSKLVVCPDQDNPGPTDCVIDESFMGAIMGKKTLIEAVKDGDLKATWTLTTDNDKKSAYNLRSLMILRQNRILPLAWEVAAKRVDELKNQATLMDLISCFSGDDVYNTYSQGFNVNNVAWCRGLIDPYWVLKAPLSYCSKQGVGSYILDKTLVPGQPAVANTPAIPSSLEITRDDNYCADYQTCLQKGADGSCLFYGHCNEEKRIWTFGQASCDPVYNTCQSFTSPSGTRLNYLTNTLDFSCDQKDVGCLAYLLRGELVSNRINWDEDFVSYFDNDLANCSLSAEGCTELMRIKAGWGANLIKVSDLSVYDDNYDLTASTSDFAIYSTNSGATKEAKIITQNNEKIIKLVAEGAGTSTISLFSNNVNPLTPGPVPIIEGMAYTFSADVYIASDDTKVQLVLGPWASNFSETREKDEWQKLSRTFYIDETQAQTINDLSFQVVGIGTTTAAKVDFNIKNLKLEVGSWDTDFSLYGSSKTHQKLIPPYLASVCYEDAFSGSKDYRLKDDAPAICNNFTRQCNKEEVGCQSFTSKDDGFSVTAKVATTDYCWGDCQGYDMYIAQASQFHSPSSENIIPANSQFCQSSEVGCTEFTNLENIASGGEQREYFSQLRRCIKPSADCADFYTWEGSDESGYQLKTMRLKENASSTPFLISSDASCSEEIYFKPPSDPEYNPDCRQVYNKEGEISYVSLFNTVVCSANCQTYRMTEKNIDTAVTSEADCNSAPQSTNWDSDLEVCYSCINGGTWDENQEACVYQGLPSESVSCSASVNGCREYTGKLGSNVRLITAFDFSNGLSAWEMLQCEGANAHIPSLSSVSTFNNGQSLRYEISSLSCDDAAAAEEESAWLSIKRALASYDANGIKLALGYNLSNNKAYSLRILAKAKDSDVEAHFSIESSTSTQTFFEPEPVNIEDDGQWHIYDLYLPILDYEVDEDTALVIRANEEFYIDSLILNEVNDKYYLIKNSSYIPEICYYDVLDNYRGVDYNLGCSAWTGVNNTSHYLRRFSSLCDESSAGCELMVNTHNYSNWDSLEIEDNDGNLIISTPADSFIYAIYNPDKSCSASNKGCSKMAQISGQDVNRSLTEVFKKNDPDNYGDSICSANALGCQQFSSGAGVYYFKDPGFNTCVYRHPNDPEDTGGRNWYKSEVKRCDLDDSQAIEGGERFGRVCLSDNDCLEGIACITDENDYPCSVSYLKTIGLGNRVPTPDMAVGVCESQAVGCTEYIDPYSAQVSNLVFNPSYLNGGEGWNSNKQEIIILPNTLYQFSANSAGPKLTASTSLDVLQSDNSFLTTSVDLEIATESEAIIFNSRANTSIEVDNDASDSYITVKPVILDYQLKQNLDKSSCNGIVNTNNGCVLFNERSISGRDFNSFSFDPFDTEENKSPKNCEAGDVNCLANVLIKAEPDRTCARWLDCLTYVDDPETGERICYDLGECTSLDEYGNCSNFISFVDQNNDPLISNGTFGINPNASGYSTADRYYIGEMKEVGLNTSVHYDFETSLSLACTGPACQFDNNIIEDSIVNSPEKSEVDYPAQGKNFLKVDSNKIINPHSANTSFNLEANKDYFIHFLLNTSLSGQSAKIVIKNLDQSNDITLLAQSNEGWSRVVRRVQVSESDSYKIYLSSDGEEGSSIYFDDIHIEPVLQVGPSEFIAKDCRLFPETNSFACRSSQDNVIKNGLEGYCLEKDPESNVCLMWYPVDQISSSQLNYGKSMGYQGKAPLYYCSEVNANFVLMEKRKATFLKSYESDVATEDSCSIVGFCNSSNAAGWNYMFVRERKKDSNIVNEFCIPRLENVIQNDTPYLVVDSFSFPNSHGVCSGKTSVEIANMEYGGNHFFQGVGLEAGFYNIWVKTNGLNYAGGANLQVGGEELNEYQFHDPPLAVYDLDNPPQSELSLKFIDHYEQSKVYDLTCNAFVELVDPFGENKAWVKRVSSQAEPYETPQYMDDKVASSSFYIDPTNLELGQCQRSTNQNIPNCAQYQDFECRNNPSCYYCGNNAWWDEPGCSGNYCTCNYFANGCSDFEDPNNPVPANCAKDADGSCVYNPDADNCSDHNNDKGACTADPNCEFIPTTNINIKTFDRYGRLREDVPYGAAILPDNFNFYSSNLIPLRDQYSQRNNEEVLAGRPYGCRGEGCGYIGQCSLNPNVFCIYYGNYDQNKYQRETYNYVNASSCAKGGYGVCTPLWYGHYDRLNAKDWSFFTNPLSSIFLKSYSALLYNPETRTYGEAGDVEYKFGNQSDFTWEGSGDLATRTTPREDENEWSAVYPSLDNLQLKDLEGDIISTSSSFTITKKGIYLLSFTSQIDEEQQPLRNIQINWGDGSLQNVYNQDSRPFASRPHQFYYYFNEGNYNLSLKIVDNWGYFDTIP